MKLNEVSEVELYFVIDLLGWMRWRLNHDAADGRIEDGKHIDEELESLYHQQHEAVCQLTRFGINPFEKDGKTPSKAYFDWYEPWNKYIKGMPEDEYKKLEARINNREDVSDIKPFANADGICRGK